MKKKDSSLLMEKENKKLRNENESIQINYDKISQKLEEYIQKEKLNSILIDSLRKENKSLEQRYNDKCMEIENFELKFDEISQNFSFVLEKIKSHQDSLLLETQKLKDLIGYILTCYNEKKFEYLNCIVNFILKNDTFLEKAEIGDYKKFLQNEINNNNKAKISENISESLFSTLNKNIDSDNISSFKHKPFKNRSCSAKEIIFKGNTKSMERGNTNNSLCSIKANIPKVKNSTFSYNNIHILFKNSSILCEKTNLISNSQHHKNFSAEFSKNTANSLKNMSTNNQTNDQQNNGFQSESKNSENSLQVRKNLF